MFFTKSKVFRYFIRLDIVVNLKIIVPVIFVIIIAGAIAFNLEQEIVEEEIIESASEIDEPEIIEPNPVVEEIAEVKLKVNYNGACWTEIYDAFGNVLFYDLGNNDQDVIVSGVAPLDVLFGAIDQVNNIKVDDQDFALPITSRRGSVLRFEIATLE